MFTIKKLVNVDAFFSGFTHNYESDFIFTGERHDFWEFLYVIDGCMDVFEEDRIYEVSSGKIIFYAPMEFHSIRAARGTCPTIIIMTFSLSGEGFDILTDGIFDVGAIENDLITEALSSYEESTKSYSPIKSQLAALKIEELILRLLEKQIPTNEHIKTASTENYKMIVKFLNEHVYENLSSEEIAKSCGLSLSNLKKTFKKYSGLSIKKYYNSLRILKSLELINQGKSMAEISDMLNYSSQHYFTVAFKKQYGIPPTKHKKTY